MATENSCNIPLVLLENFTAPTFVNTGAIRNSHHFAPRFGHTNDMYYLLEGSHDDQKDYIKGLLASTLAIGFFYLFWVIFLVVFKYMGPNEVGFLSGKLKPLPPKPSSSSDEWIPWIKSKKTVERRLSRMRIAVCLCGVVIITSACLMSVKGVASLTSSLDSGTTAIEISQKLARRAIALIDQAVEQSKRTGEAVDSLMVDLNDICPAQRPQGICADINDVTTCDFEGIFDSPVIESTLRNFKEAETSVYFQELNNARQDLTNFLSLASDLKDKAESFNAAFYVAMIFSLALTVLCVLIIFGMMCRSSRIMLCLQHCIVMPAFTILVIIAFFFSMAFVLGSMTVADLCYDSPDDKILIILNRFQEQLSPIVVEIASFYINACPADAVPQQISTQMDFLIAAGPTLENLSSMVNSSTATLQDFCGFTDTDKIFDATDIAQGQLCQIIDFLDSIRRFFQCVNWFPLYDVTLYRAICYNGTDGFTWVASTQFVLVFFACVVMTLRAAFYDIEIEGGESQYDDPALRDDANSLFVAEDKNDDLYLDPKGDTLEHREDTMDDDEDSLSPRRSPTEMYMR